MIMKNIKNDDFEKLWERTRMSPTSKMKQLKGSTKNKTLKINTLLQAPLLLSSQTDKAQRTKQDTFQGRTSYGHSKLNQSKQLSQSINTSKSQNKFGKTSKHRQHNYYKDMLEEDMKYLQDYKISISKYEEAVPSLKWPYLFMDCEMGGGSSQELRTSK